MNKHSAKFMKLVDDVSLRCLSHFDYEAAATRSLERFCFTDVDEHFSDAEGYTEADREVLKASRQHCNSPQMVEYEKERADYVEQEFERFCADEAGKCGNC